MSSILWEASEDRKSRSHMKAFMDRVAAKHNISNYAELHRWSVGRGPSKTGNNERIPAESDFFWQEVIEYFELIYEGDLSPNYKEKSFLKYNWFPNLKLNFAENLLAKGRDEDIALISLLESGQRREMTYRQLRSEVARVQEYLKPIIEQGDVVAAYMPNLPETIIGMLATTSLGGVFTSTSADFGIQGVVDRFGQTNPKVLITVGAYEYGGKRHSLKNNIEEIARQLTSLKKIIVAETFGGQDEISDSVSWNEIPSTVKTEPTYLRQAFSAPAYIMYSSGTTGKPKCIVHSAGGTLLQHVKELGLHCDLKRESKITYFTTCGWMMWNWLVSSLGFGATVGLYEGSPGYPNLKSYMNLLDQEGFNIVGTSPKFLKSLEDSGYDKAVDLPNMETLLSTGAPLGDEQFDFVYNKVKPNVMLASIAGGTDIIGCFMLGNPLLPVRKGEITCLGLGMDVAVFDEDGNSLIEEEGELVCRQSFPSQPVYFWDDDDLSKYRASYFSVFPDIWRHGDYVRLSKDGTVKVFGRSDATLNPGGVRIGTAEIYSVVESMNGVADSICVGVKDDDDVEIQLFVFLDEGQKLNEDLVKEIKNRIRTELTARHVPRKIFEVTGIPYTRSGKKMETAVSKIMNGKKINNIEAVANPDVLECYQTIRSAQQ